MFTLTELEDVIPLVRACVPPTPHAGHIVATNSALTFADRMAAFVPRDHYSIWEVCGN